jgi:hypothetical protein
MHGVYSEEAQAEGDAPRLFQDVCDVLDGVGFRMRDGGLGLTVEPTPEGVRVGWYGDPFALSSTTPLWSVGSSGAAHGGHGRGLNAAMAVAVGAVLRQAGYRVREENFELIVMADGRRR